MALIIRSDGTKPVKELIPGFEKTERPPAVLVRTNALDIDALLRLEDEEAEAEAAKLPPSPDGSKATPRRYALWMQRVYVAGFENFDADESGAPMPQEWEDVSGRGGDPLQRPTPATLEQMPLALLNLISAAIAKTTDLSPSEKSSSESPSPSAPAE